MQTIEAEIQRAFVALHLPVAALRHLQGEEHQSAYRSIVNTFVADERARWWWESLRNSGASVALPGGDGWRLIPQIAPSTDEAVWLVADDGSRQLPAIYGTTPAVATAVIGECYAFEYYVVSQSLGWLICENHHNVVIAIGSPVEGRLRENAA